MAISSADTITEKLAKLAISFVSDPSNTAAVAATIEICIYIIVMLAAAFLIPSISRIPFVRRKLNYGEKYTGQYVQIIKLEEGGVLQLRYSIFTVRYESYSKGYVLRGFQYDNTGRRIIDFDSENVSFKRGPIPYIEFIWASATPPGADTSADRDHSGYTKMCPDDPDNKNIFEGRGYFVTFRLEPTRYSFKFAKITKDWLANIGSEYPKVEKERIAFVVKLDAYLKKHPEMVSLETGDSPFV